MSKSWSTKNIIFNTYNTSQFKPKLENQKYAMFISFDQMIYNVHVHLGKCVQVNPLVPGAH